MGYLRFSLEDVKQYVKEVEFDCIEIQEHQIKMEKAFAVFGDSWRDAIYIRTGKTLYLVARYLNDIHNGMRSSVEAIIKLYNKLCEYNETGTFISGVRIPDYKFTLSEEPAMPKTVIDTDPEALADFVDSLNDYIYETQNTVYRVKSRYANMQAYWSGEQYDRFGEVIQKAERGIKIQIQELDAQSIYIEKKYRELVSATKISVDGFAD